MWVNTSGDSFNHGQNILGVSKKRPASLTSLESIHSDSEIIWPQQKFAFVLSRKAEMENNSGTIAVSQPFHSRSHLVNTHCGFSISQAQGLETERNRGPVCADQGRSICEQVATVQGSQWRWRGRFSHKGSGGKKGGNSVCSPGSENCLRRKRNYSEMGPGITEVQYHLLQLLQRHSFLWTVCFGELNAFSTFGECCRAQ